ncbi:hypothetical protein D3C85_627760 [compost metagenome]
MKALKWLLNLLSYAPGSASGDPRDSLPEVKRAINHNPPPAEGVRSAPPPSPPLRNLSATSPEDVKQFKQEVAKLKDQLRSAQGGERALALRVQQLQDDWPVIHKRYFTTEGEEDRANNRKTKSGRKPKRKTQ